MKVLLVEYEIVDYLIITNALRGVAEVDWVRHSVNKTNGLKSYDCLIVGFRSSIVVMGKKNVFLSKDSLITNPETLVECVKETTA